MRGTFPRKEHSLQKHLILLMMKKLMDGKSEETNISRGTEGCRETEREREEERETSRENKAERKRKRKRKEERERERVRVRDRELIKFVRIVSKFYLGCYHFEVSSSSIVILRDRRKTANLFLFLKSLSY